LFFIYLIYIKLYKYIKFTLEYMSDFIKTNIESPKKKHFPYFRLFKLIIWIILIWISISYFSYLSFKSIIVTKETKIIKIEKWDTFAKLSNKYEKLNSFWYKIYLQNNKPDYKLKVWDYRVEKNLELKDFLNSFKNPIIKEEKITILEWWNIFDIDEYLTKKWLLKKWDYIFYVQNKEKINKLTEFFPFIKKLTTLEWFLYPDTYKIDPLNFKINTFVIKQLNNFEKKGITSPLAPIIKGKGNYKKIEEIIIMASILEKEEKNTRNKPIVAGILKKRLKEWWMIWADITVCYPHKLTSQQCKMVVSKYINEKSEYNTRTMTWLPKTPIWNPSFESIDAVINSKNSPYYFYLHDRKWWIHYWRNNTEHEYNKNKYLR